jgi:hypothetical protein
MGVTFTISERLAVVNSTGHLCPVFLKSGVYLGLWNDLMTRVSERPDKSHATQIYLCDTFGATRTQLGKTIRVSTT